MALFCLNDRFHVVVTLRGRLVSFPNVKNVVELSTLDKLKMINKFKRKIRRRIGYINWGK